MSTISTLLRAWSGRLRAMASENAAASPSLMRQNMGRMRTACIVVATLNLIYVLVFWGGPTPADPVVQRWSHQIGLAHAVMLGITVPIGLLAHVRLRSQPLHWLDLACVLLGVGTALGFAAVVTLIDQQVTNHIIPLILGAMVVTAIYLVRPLHAIVMFSVLGLVVAGTLELVQTDSAARLSNQVNLLACLMLCIVFSVQLWRQATRGWLLQGELVRQNQQLELQCETLEQLASHDELTGLLNRRELVRLTDAELLRARRRGSPTSFVLLDLDRFKQINDSHGHPVGDLALMHVARVLRAQVRVTDLLGRVGGEEFAVVLPDTPLDAAESVAMALGRSLRDTPCPLADGELRLTASLGVATQLPDEPPSIGNLYRHADQALYRAKSQGRDRVVVWAGPERAPA